MVNKESPIYAETYFPIAIGQGLYTAELPSNIPDGFSMQAYNLVATGDSVENRIGIRQSSVDWNISTWNRVLDFTCMMARGGNGAAIIWASWDESGNSRLHLIRDVGVAGGGDGYMQIVMPAYISGIATYMGNVYFVMADSYKIYHITAYDWVNDTISYTSVPSAAGIPPTICLFSFKDRFWTISNATIYFTDIAELGATGPEQWAATNYIRLDANKGYASVQKIVPLTNKLIIFTTAGVFSLLVEGEPSSWILKVLDSESISTSRNCAFEAKGVVYYANSQGVWATNGQSVAKLSGVIEDQFFLAKGTRYHTLHSYEDGMILSIAKGRTTLSTSFDAPNSRIFYSKSDPIGWTEWNIHPGDGTTNSFGANRLVEILSISPKIPTHLNSEPTVYFIGTITDSTEETNQPGRTQLLVFDGGENQARDRVGTLITNPVSCVIKTKYVDVGNPYLNKSNKQAMIEMFTSDVTHNFTTSWDIDSTTGNSTEIRTESFQRYTVGLASNLIRIPADFMFRRCALTLKTALQTNTSQIKIKDIALVISRGREEAEAVR